MSKDSSGTGRPPKHPSEARSPGGAAPSASPEPSASTEASPASRWVVNSYVGLLNVAAFSIILVGGFSRGMDLRWGSIAMLTALAALGASMRERELGPHVGVSFGTVILAASLPLAGPIGAAIVGYVSHIVGARNSRSRARLFNAGMTACLGAGGGLVYRLCGGESPLDHDATAMALLLGVAAPMVVGYAAMTLLNVTLVAVMARLAGGMSFSQVFGRTIRGLGWGYVTHAVVAFLFVVLWVPAKVGMFSAALVLLPLLIAQWTLSRDTYERRSHTRTVSTLVAALEAANPYSVGHSARVAELCRRMAPRLGITGSTAEELHFAALLHDIGMVAVPPQAPRASGPVDVGFLVAMSEHPQAGVRMLQDIDFLANALPGILHHHERLDGKGYPAGLRGEEIPWFARVIAVADAFDSLTTTRSYRDPLDQAAALRQLRGRVGTHLDGEVVGALADALADRAWEPTLIHEDLRSALGDVHDHDDPLVSDQYAQWSPDADHADPGQQVQAAVRQGEIDGTVR